MSVTQSHFRFGVNEGTESTHGWHALEDQNPAPGGIPNDTTFLLRFTLQCDGTLQSNVDAEFQYRKNGGTWTQITTGTTNVKAVTTTVFANADNTTKRLSGTGTFESSSQGCTHDGISGGTAFDIVANGNGETECSLQLVGADLAEGDLIEFRLTRDGGTLIDTYSVTPALTVHAQTAQTYDRRRIQQGPFPFPMAFPDRFPSAIPATTVELSGLAAAAAIGALAVAASIDPLLSTGVVGSTAQNSLTPVTTVSLSGVEGTVQQGSLGAPEFALTPSGIAPTEIGRAHV